jgi:hypothetical protein
LILYWRPASQRLHAFDWLKYGRTRPPSRRKTDDTARERQHKDRFGDRIYTRIMRGNECCCVVWRILIG